MAVKLKVPLTAEAGVGSCATEATGIDAATVRPARKQEQRMIGKGRRLRMVKSSCVALTTHTWSAEITGAVNAVNVISLADVNVVEQRICADPCLRSWTVIWEYLYVQMLFRIGGRGRIRERIS